MKLQVDSKVLDALKAAFPRPERSAKRALDKYVSQLEAMLIASFHRNQSIAQRRLGLFDLSLHELANRGGQIGPNKQRLHTWLSANGLALIEVVTRGDKFSKAVSQVIGTAAGARAPTGKMTFQAPAQWTIGDLAPQVVKRGYDLVPIDLSSLRAYMAWLGGGSVKMPASARETAAVQAKSRRPPDNICLQIPLFPPPRSPPAAPAAPPVRARRAAGWGGRGRRVPPPWRPGRPGPSGRWR